MGGRDIETRNLGPVRVTAAQQRRAAIHLADHVASQHPTEHDDTDPELAGRLIAKDPSVRADVLELLDAIGYRKEPRT